MELEHTNKELEIREEADREKHEKKETFKLDLSIKTTMIMDTRKYNEQGKKERRLHMAT